ncbi:hypothetical protein GOP47_0030074 [Adiantum capillus-veneris]|nr:hypothetical protein GOP47_0030074 [Adiantum capillus-veneris]
MKIDASDRDVFDLTGPKHLCNKRLTSTDKHAVVAALVQAVYVAEVDRQQRRLDVYALAPKWWNELGYEPVGFLTEEEQSEPIIGMVFKRADHVEEDFRSHSEEDACSLPAMVVALRGTMLYHGESLQNDMLANLYVILHQLHTTARFATALKSIRHAINEVGLDNATIAGHSLGAAIALLAGQTLAYEGTLVDTHLFNPPHPSPPIEPIKSRGWKLGLSLAGMACATGLSYLLLDADKRQTFSQEFFCLKVWHPHLYINVRDPVCSSYISYFNSHDFMQQIGVGSLAQLAAPVSLRGTIQQYLVGDCKAFHLIPCAHLHVMSKRCAKLVRPHGLHQWWWPDLEVEYQKATVGLCGESQSTHS